MLYEVNPFCVRGQENDFPHNEWYIGNVLVFAHFSSKLAHTSNTYCLCSIAQLFRFLGIVKIFSPC